MNLYLSSDLEYLFSLPLPPGSECNAEPSSNIGTSVDAGLGAGDAGLGADVDAGLGADVDAGLGADVDAGLGAVVDNTKGGNVM